ncbi:MAG TPA: hypothetical protein PK629_11025 [Oscillospiraceae bacterium]|nr:hypothetical protein [Oscillospiraceae bacterium]HPF55996.1 hypothetical protein [Clostridiales bacterium]HPK36210.1 hypothetical protein [Oscillospiraceae bacterium]HPR75701.1 hypothetical protein [Oscillospiraceae bacterium]
MKITATTENNFVIQMSADELAAYGLDFPSLDYSNEPTRRLVADLIRGCKRRFDFPGADKYFVNAYHRKNGCRILIRTSRPKRVVYEFGRLSDLYELAERCGEELYAVKSGMKLFENGSRFFLTMDEQKEQELNIISEFAVLREDLDESVCLSDFMLLADEDVFGKLLRPQR